MGLTAEAGVDLPADLPVDCGHGEFSLGCPRCFFEMKGIVNGEIRMVGSEETKVQARVEGAVLLNWHLLTVFEQMERKLLPMTQSMDLQKNELARALIVNLKQLTTYMVGLVGDPQHLVTVLTEAEAFARTITDEIDRRKASGEPTPGTPTPLVTLT